MSRKPKIEDEESVVETVEDDPTPVPDLFDGETQFPEVRVNDFVRVGELPGIVIKVDSTDPLDILCSVHCWVDTQNRHKDFARLRWSGSGDAGDVWDWVARL